jgi:formamidopyrimidine-DNA glycosylase
MPELPEVETVVRALDARLNGRRVEGVECRFPGVYEVGPGIRAHWPLRIRGARRRAKLVLLDLDEGLVLVTHLRMTGALSVESVEAVLEPHTHVRIRLDGDEELRFVDPRRFGRVRLESPATLAQSSFFASLGPEPLELDEEGLASRIGASRASVKAALLDQRRVAGIGNIYADEILHAAGIHPRQPADTVRPGEWKLLLESVRRILNSAIERGGSTIRDYRSPDGAGSYQDQHRVFGRTDEPCPACGERIRKIRVAGRGTHFCPGCQPKRRRRRRSAPPSRISR